jgi:hypothetical protein
MKLDGLVLILAVKQKAISEQLIYTIVQLVQLLFSGTEGF